MNRTVIDLSSWNQDSKIDWRILKENIDGVIIRVGYRGYSSSGTLITDKMFKIYADNCVKYEIPFGVYWYAQDITQTEAILSAKYVIKLLKKYKLNYPVYYDVEYSGAPNNSGRADSLGKMMRTNCVIAFCEQIKSAGFESGVYASEEWFDEMLYFNKLKDYSIWCAKWNKDNGSIGEPPVIKSDIWQYTSKGSINGISKTVDVSLDKSAFITSKQSIEIVARDVITGKYGNGQKRKELLKKAGYNYEEVQKKVNELLKKK